MSKLLKILLIPILATCVVAIYVSCFGWILSKVFPGTHYEAIILVMGSTIIILLCIVAFVMMEFASQFENLKVMTGSETVLVQDSNVALDLFPDEKCYCGSRRKYKNCHGSRERFANSV
jgi:hypothetical protein